MPTSPRNSPSGLNWENTRSAQETNREDREATGTPKTYSWYGWAVSIQTSPPKVSALPQFTGGSWAALTGR